MLIVCPHCHTKNRLQPQRFVDVPQCGACHQPLLSLPLTLNGIQLNAILTQTVLPVIVDFWAVWCAPCKSFAPVFSQVCKQMQGKIIFAKVDTDAELELAQRYQIRSIPTIIAFQNGREMHRMSGAIPKLQLEHFANQLL